MASTADEHPDTSATDADAGFTDEVMMQQEDSSQQEDANLGEAAGGALVKDPEASTYDEVPAATLGFYDGKKGGDEVPTPEQEAAVAGVSQQEHAAGHATNSITAEEGEEEDQTNPIWEPLEYDIISGRGALANAHEGNKKFRALCFARKALFDVGNHAAKKRICAEIWNECVQKYGARYLKRHQAKGPWFEQPAEVAELKAAQVMRDYKRPDRLLQREIMVAQGKKRTRATATPMDHVEPVPVPAQPLVECPEGVHPHDVLAGRGAFVNGHPGNQRLRELAAERKDAFDAASYTEKKNLAIGVVESIRQLQPPGRFLAKDSEGVWTELNYEKCVHKACQVMRDYKRADRKDREVRRQVRKERKETRMAELAAAIVLPPVVLEVPPATAIGSPAFQQHEPIAADATVTATSSTEPAKQQVV